MYKLNTKSLVLLVILFLLALFIGDVFIYGLFVLVLSIVGVAFLTGKRTYNNLVNIVWKGSNKVYTGDMFKLDIEFYHSGFLPIPYIKVNTNLSQKLTGVEEKSEIHALSSGSKIILSKHILCKHKGIFKIGSSEIEFGDVFGIFQWKKVFDSDVVLYVYPKISLLKSLNIPMRQPFGTVPIKNNAYEDFASVRDIRKYNVGDSLKRIHWKVTAHKGAFHVKNVELNAAADIHIFLDLFAESYAVKDMPGEYRNILEDKGAECAISIVQFALSRNMSVHFAAKAEGFVNVSGISMSKLHDFLDVITKNTINGDMPIWELFKKEMPKISLGATAIIITPCIDTSALNILFASKQKGIDPVIIYLCEDRYENQPNIQALRENNFRIYVVGIQDDIRQILGGSYEKPRY